MPHHVSNTRRAMSMENRAAQFAPFAALSGHNAAIAETARLTFKPVDMSDDELQLMSQHLNRIMSLSPKPVVTITFFKHDELKSGGRYTTVTGRIKKIEECYNMLTLDDLTEIPLDSILSIDCAVSDDSID